MKSVYMLSKWQLKKVGFQILKDLLSSGKQKKLWNILSQKQNSLSLESKLKRKHFLQSKKHNAPVTAPTGEEKISQVINLNLIDSVMPVIKTPRKHSSILERSYRSNNKKNKYFYYLTCVHHG